MTTVLLMVWAVMAVAVWYWLRTQHLNNRTDEGINWHPLLALFWPVLLLIAALSLCLDNEQAKFERQRAIEATVGVGAHIAYMRLRQREKFGWGGEIHLTNDLNCLARAGVLYEQAPNWWAPVAEITPEETIH